LWALSSSFSELVWVSLTPDLPSFSRERDTLSHSWRSSSSEKLKGLLLLLVVVLLVLLLSATAAGDGAAAAGDGFDGCCCSSCCAVLLGSPCGCSEGVSQQGEGGRAGHIQHGRAELCGMCYKSDQHQALRMASTIYKVKI
jgi:hypothetical protein